MAFLVIMNAAIGFLLALIALPLIADKIGPNLFYGFRVRRTLADPEVWYKTNHYAGIQLFFAGAGVMIVAVGFSLIPGIDANTYTQLCIGVSIVLVTIATIRSFIYLSRIK
jgi:hypothetical protein